MCNQNPDIVPVIGKLQSIKTLYRLSSYVKRGDNFCWHAIINFNH